jgi:hypothetical protein
LAFAAAASFVLYGCATAPAIGTERGQGTPRQIRGSVEDILAAARTTSFFAENHTRTVTVEGGAIYAVPNDAIDRMRRRFVLMTSPTDANGDTLVEAYWFFNGITGPKKTKYENTMLDLVAGALEGAVRPSTKQVVAGRAPMVIPKPAASAAPPSAPLEKPVDSDVDRPKNKRAQHPADFAVIVGVEKYADNLPAAPFAERDAAAARATLVSLGWPERNIKLLTGARATKSNMEAYLEDWLPRSAKEDGAVFVYFAGNGAPDPSSSKAYLVPFDGDANFLEKTAYPVKKVFAALGRLKAKRIVVALDAGFSGAGGRSILPDGARPLVTQVDASVAQNGKIALFSAASAKEITSTLQDQGHGTFTYYFLKGLQGAAADDSGAITAQTLYDYLKPQVQDAASRQSREQTPRLEGASAQELVRP